MSYRRYRRRNSVFPAELLLFIGGALLLLLLFPSLASSSSNVLAISFFVAFCVGIAAVGLLLYIKKKENQRLKALAISNVDHMTGVAFEQYVGELLRFQGYTIQFTKVTGDFGGDIIAKKENNLFVIQVKRYNSHVGPSAVQQVVAAMKYYKASASMVVTNNYFTREATELAKVNDCALVNRNELAQWIYQFQSRKS